MTGEQLSLEVPKPWKPSAQRVLDMLRDAGPRGITSGEFAAAYLLTFSQRMSEMSKTPGVSFVSRPVGGGSAQWRYWLAEYFPTEKPLTVEGCEVQSP